MPHERKGVVDLYDVSDDWIPIYDRTDLDGFYVAIGTSGNQFKNAGVAGHCMSELIEAVEAGHDHDTDPLVVNGRYTGLPIDMGTSAATARSTSTPPCQSTADQEKDGGVPAIANGPTVVPFLVHSQPGPMARDIGDLALFADAMVGESPLAGLGKPPPQQSFRSAAAASSQPGRVAFSVDLGVTETAAEVAEVCSRAMHALQRDGVDVVTDHPDLSDAEAAFDVPGALRFAALLGAELGRRFATC